MDQKDTKAAFDSKNIDKSAANESDSNLQKKLELGLENTLKSTKTILENTAPVRILLDTFEQQNLQFDDFGDVIIGDRLSKPEFPG